jgi:hypothetical protein
MVHGLVIEYQWDTPRLIMYEHLGKCLAVAKKKAAWLLKIEGEPFTVNDHYMADYKEKFLVYYRRVRRETKKKTTYNSGTLKPATPKRGNTAGRKFESPFESPSSISKSSGFGEEVVDPITEALTALSRAGYPGLTEEDLPKLLGQDVMEPALEIMATVRAYFQGTLKITVEAI